MINLELAQELIDRVWNYASDIVDGKIPASKKHIYACQRFFDDMEKSESEDYKYYFDYEELYYFYEWSRMFTHKEGVLAGQPIELNDWQLFIVANLFAWKRKDNGNRRFKRAYIQVARKNAKSFLQSLIASYIAFLSEEKQQIYIAGIKKDQSKIVYDQILSQINGCKALKGKFKTSYGKITITKNDSVIRPLSKDDGKKGDGLFPSLAVIDELHLHMTSELYDVLLSGMIGRKNALIVAITTAGLDLNSFGYQEYQYVSKIIDPHNTEVENEEYFIMICELEPEDDIRLEENFIKANPIVATYQEGLEDLRSRLKVALVYEEKMTEYLTKHMNIWCNRRADTYMNLEKWNNCVASEENPIPDLQNKEVYIGVDLSATLDLTSVTFEIPIGDGKFVVLSHSFMPEDTLQEKLKSDKGAKYNIWEKKGYITLTEGSVVDYDYVQRHIEKEVKKYNWNVKGIFVDFWNATQFMNSLQSAGFIVVEVKQQWNPLAPATKNFRELVYKGMIIHDDNPVLNWAMGNAVAKTDDEENIKLSKKLSTERIDPVASLIDAHVHCQFHYQNGDVNEMVTDEFLDKLGW